MKNKWNLNNISESRGILMGLATVMILFFHSYRLKFSFELLGFIRKCNNIGVDLFLIISALGLYYSFSKNSDIKQFYKKRMIRIIPPGLIVAIIYYLYLKVDVFSFLKGVFLINIFTDGIRHFWYSTLIVIMYLLYPLLYKIIKEKDLKGLIGLLLIVVGSTILMENYLPVFYKHTEILFTRIPVFLVGIYIGKYSYENKEIPAWINILMIILMIGALFLLKNYTFKHYMCVRYLHSVVGIFIVFIVSYLHSLFKVNVIDKILLFFGTYSFELYLIYERIGQEIIKAKIITINNYYLYYFVILIISIILSMLLKVICEYIVKLTETKKA